MRKLRNPHGISLVELLIAMVILSGLILMIANVLLRGDATMTSVSLRFYGAPEIHALINDIQRDLWQGAYISNNSYDKRLEYTTYDSNGNALRKIYRINSTNNLELSLDGGSSWLSPYRISDSTKYKLGSSAKFLYSWPTNNCTDFSDDNSNGVWATGESTAAVNTCPNFSGSALSSPSGATKVDLSNFSFTTNTGNPVMTRTLPGDVFIALGPGYVRSTSVPTAPAVKDSPLVQKFDINTANSLYDTSFDIRGLSWDSSRDRLALAGHMSTVFKNLYLSDRDGVIIGPTLGIPLLNLPTQPDSVAFMGDGSTVLVLDATAKILFQFSLNASPPIPPINSGGLSLSSLTTPKSIAYDASTPSDFYVVSASGSSWKVEERTISANSLVGSAWALPAAFDATHPPAGMAIEPITGDFLVARNYVNGSGVSSSIDIYRISRSNGTSTSFSVNTNDLGSTATGTTGNWGLAYDPDTNRLFLSDNATDKVYEVVPSVLISPHS